MELTHATNLLHEFVGFCIKIAIPPGLEPAPILSSFPYPVEIVQNSVTLISNPLRALVTYTSHLFLFLVIFPHQDSKGFKNCSEVLGDLRKESVFSPSHDLPTYYCPNDGRYATQGSLGYFLVLTKLEERLAIQTFLLDSPFSFKYVELFLFWVAENNSEYSGVYFSSWAKDPISKITSFSCPPHHCLTKIILVSKASFSQGSGVFWTVFAPVEGQTEKFKRFQKYCDHSLEEVSPFTRPKKNEDPNIDPIFESEPPFLYLLLSNGSRNCYSNIVINPNSWVYPNFAISINNPLAEYTTTDIIQTLVDSYNFITCDGVQTEPPWLIYTRPFDLGTWTILLLSVVVIFSVLTQYSESSTIFGRLSFAFLLLDQGGNLNPVTSSKVKSLLSQGLLTIWCISALTLGSGYKGVLLSHFGLPFPSWMGHEKILDLRNFTLFSTLGGGFFTQNFTRSNPPTSMQFTLPWGKLWMYYASKLEHLEEWRLLRLMQDINVEPRVTEAGGKVGYDLMKYCKKTGLILRNALIQEELRLGNELRRRSATPFMKGMDNFLRFEKSFAFSPHPGGVIFHRFRRMVDTGLVAIWEEWEPVRERVLDRRNQSYGMDDGIQQVGDVMGHIVSLVWICALSLAGSVFIFASEYALFFGQPFAKVW